MIALPKVYSQRDERWKDNLLGFSTVSTIGSYGCIVTCLAMIARYFGKDTDPDKVNSDLRGVDGFQGEVYYKWGRLNRLYPDINFTKFVNTPDTVTPAQFAEIDAHLKEEFPVILKVDYNPATTFVEQHFVLLIGKVGNSYKIADPWTGKIESLFDKYGTAKYAIERFIFYEGPLLGGGDDMTEKEKEIQNDIIKDLRNLEKEVRKTLPNQIADILAENSKDTAKQIATSALDVRSFVTAKLDKLDDRVNALEVKGGQIKEEIKENGKEVNTTVNTDVKYAIKEGLKELLRVSLFALASLGISYLASLPPTPTVAAGTIILKGLDKFIHKVAKAVDDKALSARLVTGLSRF